MRLAAFALVGALGFTTFSVPASATPAVPNLAAQQASNIVEVAGGCGRGFHRNRWGRCVPYRYGYYRPRPYWGGYRYGYYGPRPYWRSPSDYVANQLNRQELLGRGYYPYR